MVCCGGFVAYFGSLLVLVLILVYYLDEFRFWFNLACFVCLRYWLLGVWFLVLACFGIDFVCDYFDLLFVCGACALFVFCLVLLGFGLQLLIAICLLAWFWFIRFGNLSCCRGFWIWCLRVYLWWLCILLCICLWIFCFGLLGVGCFTFWFGVCFLVCVFLLFMVVSAFALWVG